jgi:hypothetical protein
MTQNEIEEKYAEFKRIELDLEEKKKQAEAELRQTQKRVHELELAILANNGNRNNFWHQTRTTTP